MTPEPPFGRISPDQQAEWDREEAAAQARWEQMDRAEQIKAQIAADESEPDLEPTPESIEQAGPVPYTLTLRAEGVLASWDRFHALERAERVALGEAEPEPEAEL